jgi:hypothetical protein
VDLAKQPSLLIETAVYLWAYFTCRQIIRLHNKEKIEKLIDEEIEEEQQTIDHPPRTLTQEELVEHYRKKGRLASLRQSFEKLER